MEHAKNKKKGKSYIIIEVRVLLAILATIVFLAVPRLMKTLDNSRQASADNDAKIIVLAAKTWLTEQSTAELVPKIGDDLYLDQGSVDEILSTAPSIDEKVIPTVKIKVSGKEPPHCYSLVSVELSKGDFKAVASE